MASRPKFWPRPRSPSRPRSRPRPRSFGLEALASASASNIWPRPGLDLVVLLCNRAFSGKNRVKFRKFVNLKLYAANHYLVLFHNYFWPRPWSQPPEIGLGLGLVAVASASASASASRFWPHLT